MIHEEINLSLLSEVIHGHLIVLVRHKQAQNLMYLQSGPTCYKQISKYILFKFLLPYLLTHSLMCSVKCSGKLASYSFTPLAKMLRILWQKDLSQC